MKLVSRGEKFWQMRFDLKQLSVYNVAGMTIETKDDSIETFTFISIWTNWCFLLLHLHTLHFEFTIVPVELIMENMNIENTWRPCVGGANRSYNRLVYYSLLEIKKHNFLFKSHTIGNYLKKCRTCLCIVLKNLMTSNHFRCDIVF